MVGGPGTIFTEDPKRRMLVGPPYRGHRIGPTRSRRMRRMSCKDSAGSAVGWVHRRFPAHRLTRGGHWWI